MNKYLHHILKVILKCFSEILMDLWKFFLLLCIGFIRFKFPLNVRTCKYSQNSFALTLKRTFIDTKYCLFYLLLDIVSPALNTIIEIRNALQSWKFLDSFVYRTMNIRLQNYLKELVFLKGNPSYFQSYQHFQNNFDSAVAPCHISNFCCNFYWHSL